MTEQLLVASQETKPSSALINWAERGLIPDTLIRTGIRRLNQKRLAEIHSGDLENAALRLNAFVNSTSHSVIAPLADLANEQHYEVPAEFFGLVMGNHRKYSCCYWDKDTSNLTEAEVKALQITCQHAGIKDGMRVLDLGCGWGSLSLWIAQNYPECQVFAVSNSHSQREHIMAVAQMRGLENIAVQTCDMNTFDSQLKFDRIVSVEMFEHMRNYGELYRRIGTWLKPEGRFFKHIFCHRNCAYEFVDNGPSDWMSRHFFSGGMMPSADFPLRFQQNLSLVKQWRWNGHHYEKTANAWLQNMDDKRESVMSVLAETYGADNADKWFMRWRIFFMACAELFAHADGNEWHVSHYLFERQQFQTQEAK